jgi:cold shock protein
MHISAVQKAGLTILDDRARVSYELQAGRNGKSSAEKLRMA